MYWAKTILLVLQIVRSFVQFANERGLLSDKDDEALNNALQKQRDDLAKARAARIAQRAINNSVPATDSLPNDGFRRD
jgi:hypothetical protein